MRRLLQILRGRGLAKTWLAGLLVVLMLALTFASALHRDHQDHAAGQHHCAICLMAHGSVLADGTIGATVYSSTHVFNLPTIGESKRASICDLRLASGRAPPV